MIIYGTNSKQIGKEILFDKCSNCGTSNTIEMYAFQKYAHVFWIPIFPIGKTGISQCDHCKQILKLEEMPAELKGAYDSLRLRSKTPIWVFSGLVVIAVLIGVGIIFSNNRNKENAQWILDPKVGDVYEIKTANRQYTLAKIHSVVGDSVNIQFNAYETDKESGISQLNGKPYNDEIYVYAKSELKMKLETREIIDIER
jgi:zinc-ribbon family